MKKKEGDSFGFKFICDLEKENETKEVSTQTEQLMIEPRIADQNQASESRHLNTRAQNNLNNSLHSNKDVSDDRPSNLSSGPNHKQDELNLMLFVLTLA